MDASRGFIIDCITSKLCRLVSRKSWMNLCDFCDAQIATLRDGACIKQNPSLLFVRCVALSSVFAIFAIRLMVRLIPRSIVSRNDTSVPRRKLRFKVIRKYPLLLQVIDQKIFLWIKLLRNVFNLSGTSTRVLVDYINEMILQFITIRDFFFHHGNAFLRIDPQPVILDAKYLASRLKSIALWRWSGSRYKYLNPLFSTAVVSCFER